jgi:hypothetical protein
MHAAYMPGKHLALNLHAFIDYLVAAQCCPEQARGAGLRR